MEDNTTNSKSFDIKNEQKCEILENVFKNKNTLKNHFITIHGNINIGNVGKAFNFNICLKSFSRAENLKKHNITPFKKPK